MTTRDKLQHLIITSLLSEGTVKIMLPNQTTLEFGITQEGKDGDMELVDDYCWVTVSQDDRTAHIDTYNLELGYPDHDQIIFVDHDEEERRRVAVV